MVSRKGRVSQELRFQVLSELMRVAASSLDMAETFDHLGEQVKRLIDYDTLSFGFLRPGDEHLEIYAITGSDIEGKARGVFEDASNDPARFGWQKVQVVRGSLWR